MIAIAVLGHGVVGSGVAELLEKNRENISRKVGEEIVVKKILVRREFPGARYQEKFTKSFEDILSDPEIKVVAEVMGGLSPAYEYVSAALKAGKSVVTSNKELVAAKGPELLELAKKTNRSFLFEASVGGGIPIIRPLHQCLAANDISEIVGILNGTTNFILTKMIREQMPFADALKMAQDLGYAEKDPTADVEGLDAGRKICILASLAFGQHVYPESVRTEGITKITQEDVAYGEGIGRVVKLLGQTRKVNGKCITVVAPALISRDNPLASVEDVFNGILVRGNAAGDVFFIGRGAGKLPTASAVVGDVIDCVKADKTSTTLRWAASDGGNAGDWMAEPAIRYIRCKDAAIAEIPKIFEGASPLFRKNMPAGEFAFLTSAMTGYELEKKLSALKDQGITILGNIQVWEP